jgi:hypothetical protein
MKEVLEDIYYYFYRQYDKIRYFIHNYIENNYNLRTGLKRGQYSDIVYKIESSLFIAVEDYIARDREDAFSIINYDSDMMHSEAKQKIIDILHFYRVELPELQAKHDKILDELYGGVNFNDFINKLNKNERDEEEIKKTKELWRLDEEIHNKTQENLHKVIDVRPFLWS